MVGVRTTAQHCVDRLHRLDQSGLLRTGQRFEDRPICSREAPQARRGDLSFACECQQALAAINFRRSSRQQPALFEYDSRR